MCVGFFLRRRSCVFFLSSCSAWVRLLLSLFWCGFWASSWGACGFPRRVLPQVTLRGFRNLSGSSCLSCSSGRALLLGWRCLWCTTWFSTLCHALPPGPAVCAGCPWGFSDFSVTGCLTYCCPGGVGWATTLPLYFLCFSCAGWLAGVCWVLHPVSGSSHWGCVCSLGNSVITLPAFPYLSMGALLTCGVYGVS